MHTSELSYLLLKESSDSLLRVKLIPLTKHPDSSHFLCGPATQKGWDLASGVKLGWGII